jgi:DNA-binding IclR family transcriptional regulator
LVKAPKAPRRIKSIEVGFRTIRALEAAGGPLPLTRVAADCHMSLSKADVYLNSFGSEGLVSRDEDTGLYRLGPFAAQLGFAAIRGLDVIPAAKTEIEALGELTRCAVCLAVWGNRGPTIVFRVDGEGQGSMTMRVGHVLSPTGSACGLLFQAYLPPKRNGAASIIRRQGFATTDSGPHAGFAALAVPVLDYSGAIVAAVAAMGPAGLMNGKNELKVRRATIQAGARVSAKLGYAGSTERKESHVQETLRSSAG